jgi:hypothetical protein
LTELQTHTLRQDSPIYDPDVKPTFDTFIDNRLEDIITLVDIEIDNRSYEQHHLVAKTIFQKALSLLHIHYSEF